MRLARISRAAAIAIAVLGLIDPAVTANRAIAPVVALLQGAGDGARHQELADRVARTLNGPFRVVRGPSPDAAATVVAGDRLPAHAAEIAGPGFVVLPDRGAPAVSITSIAAPARGQLDSRLPVTAAFHVTGARGRTLEATLSRGGVVIDRVRREIGEDDVVQSAELGFVAGGTGAAAVRVSVSLPGADASASADTVIDVVVDRWRVLFVDRRPSWMSTFVRRALEDDPRFDVSFRTRTSTGAGAEAGSPPAALGDLARLEGFHSIVVGAADALTRDDLAGLEAFARRRGGSVVLLLEREPDTNVSEFVGAARWDAIRLPEPVAVGVTAPGIDVIRASEMIWPTALPPRARAIAAYRQDGTQRAVVFDAPLGAGRMLVSGLADGWRYRADAGGSGFADFWRLAIGSASAAALRPLEIEIDRPVAAPGETVAVSLLVRDLLTADVTGGARASISAFLEGPGGSHPLRLWPDGAPGRFRGAARAPATPGTYRLRALAGGVQAGAPLIVAAGARHPLPDESALVTAWAASRGGRVFAAADLDQLRATLSGLAPGERRDVRWRPMRSAWWIVPFALALGAEWWTRRRRGLS